VRRRERAGGPSVWAAIPALRRQAVAAGVLGAGVAAVIAAQAIFLAAAVAAGIEGRGWSAAAPAAWAFLAAVAVRAALTWIAEVRGRRAGSAAMADLRARLVATRLAAGGADRGGRRAGELAALATQGGAAVERWAGRVLPQVALAALVPVVALAVIVARDPLSAALLAPTLPLLIVFLVLAGGDARRVADRRFAAMSLLGAHLLDVTRGLPVLRSLGRAEVQREQLAVAGDAYRRATVGTLRSAFVSSFALEFVAMLGTALVAVVAGVRLVNGTMAFEDALVVLLLAPEIYGPLRRAGVEYHAAADARATLRRLLEVTGADQRIVPGTPGGAVADPRADAIVLERVTVSAAGGERRPLEDLSLKIAPGEATAVVGPSGAGKSTLLRVLLGLQPVTSGSVRCGGLELAAMDVDAWRARTAWMPQRPVLLPATLAENLRLADAEACDEQLWVALATAGLEPWAAGLPGGLEARLGEGGVAASAGERRRLALARIALRDPALVLVDEPTANLDAVTAALVCDALARIVAGRTAVLVTHDPDVAALAAHTVELDAGRQAEAVFA
jgi:thiol reductant ABC exporter CydD subunit